MVLIEPVNKLQCCIALCVLFCFTHGFDVLGFFLISHGGLASKHCGAGQKLLPCLPRLGARRVRIQSLQRLRWLHKFVVIILVCSRFCEGIFGAGNEPWPQSPCILVRCRDKKTDLSFSFHHHVINGVASIQMVGTFNCRSQTAN